MLVCSVVNLHVRVSDCFHFSPLWVFTKVKCFTVTFSFDLEIIFIKLYYLNVL